MSSFDAGSTHRRPRQLRLGADVSVDLLIALSNRGLGVVCDLVSHTASARRSALLTPAEVWMAWQDLCEGADRRLNPLDEEFLERLQENRLVRRITLATAVAGLFLIAAIYAIPRRRADLARGP